MIEVERIADRLSLRSQLVKRFFPFAIFVGAVTSALAPAWSAVQYTIVPFGAPNTDYGPQAINDHNVVVGYFQTSNASQTVRNGFFYDGTFHTLPSLGGTETVATSINNNGVIAGRSDLVSGLTRAFVYDGTMRDLGSVVPNKSSVANGISGNGTIVGTSFDATASRGFIYNGSMQVFGAPNTTPSAISENGLIAGRYSGTPFGAAFIYDGVLHDISNPDWPSSQARAINDLGQAAGDGNPINSLSDLHAFFYDGVMHDLGTLRGKASNALGMNNLSQVVGRDDPPLGQGGGTHAFIWDPAHGMVDLNTLIDPAAGWTLNLALDINNNGVIVGKGTWTTALPGHPTQTFTSQGFMLVPVPEPSSATLAAIGMMAWILRLRRRKRDS